jgi:tetratricopeptide (TPR) repeat protein
MGYEDDVELMLTMGRALYREGLYQRAKRVFNRLSVARPESAEAMAAMGYTLHRLGNDVDAARHLRRALRVDPDLHEARTYLGHLLYDRGDWEGALREFERIAPLEHWDSLAVWRLLELKRELASIPENAVSLAPWRDRLAQLEASEWDPVDRLLAEVEAKVAGSRPWSLRDQNQLELFGARDSARTEGPVVQVRLRGGQVLRGNCHDIVCQYRDVLGFSHEPPSAFMKRMAERWHEQYGFEVPSAQPETFLRSAAQCGLLQFHDTV